MACELYAGVRPLRATDPSIRAIILAGAGRAFCAGDELGRERTPDEQLSLRRRGSIKHYVEGPGRWTSTVRLMRSLPQPIVVRVQGYAYGAGFNLALGGDFRVMARDAKMATPFIKRGLATGTNLLQQYVGVGKAIEMTLLGEPVDAEEALRLGLVNEVVDLADLDAAVNRWAERLAAGPSAAIGLTKSAVYRGWPLDPDGAYWHQGSATDPGPRPGGPCRGRGGVQGEAATQLHRPVASRRVQSRRVHRGSETLTPALSQRERGRVYSSLACG